jgi:ERCC4-type nuclease
LQSTLEEIDGVGRQKAIALMSKFSTIDKIISASEEELAEAEGIGKELAKKIKKFFDEQYERT